MTSPDPPDGQRRDPHVLLGELHQALDALATETATHAPAPRPDVHDTTGTMPGPLWLVAPPRSSRPPPLPRPVPGSRTERLTTELAAGVRGQHAGR